LLYNNAPEDAFLFRLESFKFMNIVE
jgi:hypothetical protein